MRVRLETRWTKEKGRKKTVCISPRWYNWLSRSDGVSKVGWLRSRKTHKTITDFDRYQSSMLHDSFLPSFLSICLSLSSGILIRRDPVQKPKVRETGQTNQTRNLTHRRRFEKRAARWLYIVDSLVGDLSSIKRGEKGEKGKKERKKVKKGNIICWLSGGAARIWFAMGETSDTETLPSRRYFLGKK